ncbi:MAG: hypothetical protein ACLPN5_21125 [Roseiarcus sp.]
MNVLDFPWAQNLHAIGSTLAGGALGVFIGNSISRHQSHVDAEQRLVRAKALLEKHFAALEALDDDDTPSEALELAVRFSKFIQDARTPLALELILAKDPSALRTERATSAKRGQRLEAFDRRPDLEEAMSVAIFAGIRAFVARWPKCGPVFEDILLEIGASPVREAEKVISVANRAMSDSAPTSAAFAH